MYLNPFETQSQDGHDQSQVNQIMTDKNQVMFNYMYLPFQSSSFSPCDRCPPPPCSLSLSRHPPGTCWKGREEKKSLSASQNEQILTFIQVLFVSTL